MVQCEAEIDSASSVVLADNVPISYLVMSRQVCSLMSLRLNRLFCFAMPLLFVSFFTVTIGFSFAGFAVASSDQQWWPIPVKSYYGKYDVAKKSPGKACTSLKGPKLEEWNAPLKANFPYLIGVLVPHVKDSYWVAVNYGIIQEARRLGLGVKLLEAGGYDNQDRQIEQIRKLSRAGVDGFILGSVSYNGLDDIISTVSTTGVPVVEMINDVHAPQVSAKALVSFYDMGYYAGEFLAEHAERTGHDSIRIAFFPGPKSSGWASDTLNGFRDALQYFPGGIDIVSVKWGDTSPVRQSRLVRELVAEQSKFDYLVGNAVAAEVAPAILEQAGIKGKVGIVSTYIVPALYDMIAKGEVLASPADLTIFQARMAVDIIVRILNGEKPGRDLPFRAGPFIPTVTTDNIASYPYEGLFGPRDYKPVFELSPEK